MPGTPTILKPIVRLARIDVYRLLVVRRLRGGFGCRSRTWLLRTLRRLLVCNAIMRNRGSTTAAEHIRRTQAKATGGTRFHITRSPARTHRALGFDLFNLLLQTGNALIAVSDAVVEVFQARRECSVTFGAVVKRGAQTRAEVPTLAVQVGNLRFQLQYVGRLCGHASSTVECFGQIIQKTHGCTSLRYENVGNRMSSILVKILPRPDLEYRPLLSRESTVKDMSLTAMSSSLFTFIYHNLTTVPGSQPRT